MYFSDMTFYKSSRTNAFEILLFVYSEHYILIIMIM